MSKWSIEPDFENSISLQLNNIKVKLAINKWKPYEDFADTSWCDMNEILKDIITDIKKKAIKKEFINSLLNAYYDYVYEILDEEFYAVYNGIDEEDDDGFYYPEELILPIEQRESKIFEAMEWVIGQAW